MKIKVNSFKLTEFVLTDDAEDDTVLVVELDCGCVIGTVLLAATLVPVQVFQ